MRGNYELLIVFLTFKSAQIEDWLGSDSSSYMYDVWDSHISFHGWWRRTFIIIILYGQTWFEKDKVYQVCSDLN